jgi:hypothetical protein
MKIVASAIVICAMLLTPVHGQQLQSKTEDDVATILATIIAAERFGCIAKGTGERLTEYYRRQVGFNLADYTPTDREADRMQLHLQRASQFDHAMGRRVTCEAMRGVLARLH